MRSSSPATSALSACLTRRSLRALFGTDGQMNAAHGSDSPASAAREIGIAFPEYKQPEPLQKSQWT